jgi:hypothetical protein
MPFGLLKKLSSKQRSLNKAAHSRGDESGIRRRWKPEVDEKKNLSFNDNCETVIVGVGGEAFPIFD